MFFAPLRIPLPQYLLCEVYTKVHSSPQFHRLPQANTSQTCSSTDPDGQVEELKTSNGCLSTHRTSWNPLPHPANPTHSLVPLLCIAFTTTCRHIKVPGCQNSHAAYTYYEESVKTGHAIATRIATRSLRKDQSLENSIVALRSKLPWPLEVYYPKILWD